MDKSVNKLFAKQSKTQLSIRFALEMAHGNPTLVEGSWQTPHVGFKLRQTASGPCPVQSGS